MLFMFNIATRQVCFIPEICVIQRVFLPYHFRSGTHLELRGRFELVELGFWSDCFLEALQKDPLELHDFLDVAEKCVDLSVAQEGFFLHGFQVVLQQAVQMLVGRNGREKRNKMGVTYAFD